MSKSQQNPRPDRQAVLTKALLKAAALIGINDAELAQTIGTSPSSISRMHNGNRTLSEDSKEWELSALLIRLYRSLDSIVAGDQNSLRSWMSSYNNELEATPKEHIKSVLGLVETLDYVDANRAII